MGLGHVPSLPEKVNSRIGSESIFPVEFSLVKGEHGGPKGMTKMAVGATTKYGYVGPSDRINQTVDQIRDVCRELKNSESLKWSKFEVYLARRIISE